MSIHSFNSSLSGYSESAAPAAAGSTPSSRIPSPHSDSSFISTSDLELMIQRVVDSRLLISLRDTDSKIATLTGRVKELESDLVTKKAKVVQLTNDVAAEKLISTGLKTSVTQLTQDVTTEKAKVAKLTQELAAKQKANADLERENARLAQKHTSLYFKISSHFFKLSSHYFELWNSGRTREDQIRTLFINIKSGML